MCAQEEAELARLERRSKRTAAAAAQDLENSIEGFSASSPAAAKVHFGKEEIRQGFLKTFFR